MKQSYSSAFLVLLYGKEIIDSETLNSIKSLTIGNSLLVIWNNGPELLNSNDVIEFEQAGFDVKIIETIENLSISCIYNRFIKSYESDRYILLDDDSCLNQHYLNDALAIDEDHIGVPMIYSNKVLTGPKLNRKLCGKGDSITDKDKFFGIGSGLVIGKHIAEKMKHDHQQIFDERFYFYGVDSTFFFRVKMSCLSANMRIISGFEHSLSKLKKESLPVTEFRLKEMSYDIGLRLRYYKSFGTGFFLLLKESFSSAVNKIANKKRKLGVRYLWDAFLNGKHYRDD